MTLGQECIAAMKLAHKQFGVYAFGDKGPHEVMDIDELARKFRESGVEASAEAFKHILKDKKYGERLASAIVGQLEDWDELWTAHGELLRSFY